MNFPGRFSVKLLSVTLVALALFLPAPASAQQLVGTPFVVNDEGDSQVHSAVAYNRQWQEYLVVWYNDRPGNDDVYCQRISRRGSLVGPRRVVVAGDGAERRFPDVAWNEQANQYLVVWQEEDVSGNSYIRGQRLTAEALPDGGIITVTAGPIGMLDSRRPAVAYAFTSNRYLVVWEYEMNIPPNPTVIHVVGQVLTAAGAPEGVALTIAGDPGNAPRTRPDLAYNVARNEYLVVWQHRIGPEDVIYGRRVRGNGELLFPDLLPINSGSGGLANPAVAAVPNVAPDGQYLVTWESDLSNLHVMGQRLNGDGTDAGFVLGIGTSMGADSQPAVAGSEEGRTFLATWTRRQGILDVEVCARLVPVLDPGVLFADPEPVACFGGPQAAFSAAAAGPLADFLIAFDDQSLAATSRDLYAQLWGYRVYLPLAVRSH